jgi:transposase
LTSQDIVAMDNLSVHKNVAARTAIEAAGAEIWDLPPYRPDLNPIEQMWCKTKTDLRKAKARTPEALCSAIGEAMATVSFQDIVSWFAACGYS